MLGECKEWPGKAEAGLQAGPPHVLTLDHQQEDTGGQGHTFQSGGSPFTAGGSPAGCVPWTTPEPAVGLGSPIWRVGILRLPLCGLVVGMRAFSYTWHGARAAPMSSLLFPFYEVLPLNAPQTYVRDRWSPALWAS